MKRTLSALLVASGLMFAAGAAPAFADQGYSHAVQRDGGYRSGAGVLDEVRHRRGHWQHRHWRHRHMHRRCFLDRVCWCNKWGEKRCKVERVCRW